MTDTRTPTTILADFDAAVTAGDVAAARTLLWEILADVQDTYTQAMGARMSDATVDNVLAEVEDYLANYYGDD